MYLDDKEFCRIILNYRVECEYEENLRLFICFFKTGPNWEIIYNQRLVIKDLLKNFISYDNWYFVRCLI